MDYIVQKFGGTSLASLDLIRKAALKIKAEVEADYSVVVVVSAMSGVTNALVGHVRDLSTTYDLAEYDVVVSTGEQVTSGLLALALHSLGIPARSWQGWQLPIRTSFHHSHAHIESICVDGLKEAAQKGKVSVVSGFQGIDGEGRITTLGRGGSDTTAVALAGALKAKRCDIFTDVDGVYTADPRYVTAAGKLSQIGYRDMLELAAQGAKVLQKESVEMAMKHGVPLRVLSSLSEAPGTLILRDNDVLTARRQISGIAHSLNYAKLTLVGLPFSFALSEIVDLLAQEQIECDMVCQEVAWGEKTKNCSFLIPLTSLERVEKLLAIERERLGFYELLTDTSVAKVSVIGTSLEKENSPHRKLFQTLQQEGICVQMVNSSDIKVSVLVSATQAEKAIAGLHTIYQLDAEENEPWKPQSV